MEKKIRLIRTMIVEYTPNPEWYPEGFTIDKGILKIPFVP